jgi:hypothetical protein
MVGQEINSFSMIRISTLLNVDRKDEVDGKHGRKVSMGLVIDLKERDHVEKLDRYYRRRL